jgi:hypothetical protein
MPQVRQGDLLMTTDPLAALEAQHQAATDLITLYRSGSVSAQYVIAECSAAWGQVMLKLGREADRERREAA